MKPFALAAALSTLCLTSCDDSPKRPLIITPDPARYQGCPASFPAAPDLPALSVVSLPDGRQAVLLDVVIARETVTAKYILRGKDAWHRCRSPVVYTIDWIARIGGDRR